MTAVIDMQGPSRNSGATLLRICAGWGRTSPNRARFGVSFGQDWYSLTSIAGSISAGSSDTLFTWPMHP